MGLQIGWKGSRIQKHLEEKEKRKKAEREAYNSTFYPARMKAMEAKGLKEGRASVNRGSGLDSFMGGLGNMFGDSGTARKGKRESGGMIGDPYAGLDFLGGTMSGETRRPKKPRGRNRSYSKKRGQRVIIIR